MSLRKGAIAPVGKEKGLGLILLLALSLSARVLGAEVERGPVFTFLEENDLVVRTDRHYTQGIRFSYLHTDGFFPLGTEALYEHLPKLGFAPEIGKFGYSVGQNIYTPADLDAASPRLDDRPYAGWLYLGAILQRRGLSLGGRPTQEEIELDLGVVGPLALGRQAQTWVHEIRSFDLPQGWDHQLHNEFGARLRYQRSVRFKGFDLDNLQSDFIPRAGLSLGNVETSFRAGGIVRLGVNLPADYGRETIDGLGTGGSGRPTDPELRVPHWSVYVFAGAEGKVVAYNTFLDGNLFAHSRNVDREILVGDFKAGFGVAYRMLEIGYTQVWRTPEFHGQTEADSFGSIFVGLRF